MRHPANRVCRRIPQTSVDSLLDINPRTIIGAGDKFVLENVFKTREFVIASLNIDLCWVAVTNCVYAHMLAERALRSATRMDQVAGQAFYVGNSPCGSYEEYADIFEVGASGVSSSILSIFRSGISKPQTTSLDDV